MNNHTYCENAAGAQRGDSHHGFRQRTISQLSHNSAYSICCKHCLIPSCTLLSRGSGAPYSGDQTEPCNCCSYSLLQVVAGCCRRICGTIMKTCKTCNVQKPEDEFSKWRGSCKICLAKKQAAHREGDNHAEEHKRSPTICNCYI